MQKAYELEVYGPLIISTAIRSANDEEVQQYLGVLLAAYRREPRFAVIMDPSAVPNLPPQQRTILSAWHVANEALLRRNCLGMAYQFTSPVSRFVLSSLLLQGELPYPYAVCANRVEALAQAANWLRGAGIDPAPLLARATAARERPHV